MKTIRVPGVELTYVDENAEYFLHVITSYILEKKEALVVTPNVDHLVRIVEDNSIHEIYKSANFCLNDSRVFGALLRIFGLPAPRTITGSDLVSKLLNHDSITKTRISVVGCDVAQVEILKQKYRLFRSSDISHINPPMGFINSEVETEKVVRFLRISSPTLTLLAVGSPQQEIIGAKMLKQEYCAGVILCIGASLDYLSGKENRAPAVIQKVYMEWLYRFLRSPLKRFNRYFIRCPKIFHCLFRARFRKF